jgi:hypothetical protein
MASDPLVYGWTVPPGGFRWVRATDATGAGGKPRPALIEADEQDRRAEALRRRPPPDPALFLAFADVTPDREGIVSFANAHGTLGNGIEVRVVGRADRAAAAPVYGSFLVTWQHQISDMRRLVAVWGMLVREDREGLAPHIRWRKDAAGVAAVEFDSHPRPGEGGAPGLGLRRARAVIASPQADPERLATLTAGDPLLPAWLYLGDEIEEHLHHAASEASACMPWDPRANRPALRLAAPTLLAAVWLQLADAVTNDRTYGGCRECGRWFEVAPDAARSHRRFCSNACRSKAYRERQDRARRLHAARKTFEEIAEELDSDVAAVRRWITGARE